MTESDWLSSNDPQRMLAWLTLGTETHPLSVRPAHLISDRKLRLFACACFRINAEGIQYQQDFAGLCERWANGAPRPPRARECSFTIWEEDVALAASRMIQPPLMPRLRELAPHLLREIVGNRFRPVFPPGVMDGTWHCCGCGRGAGSAIGTCAHCGTKAVWRLPFPRNATVSGIARPIYESRDFEATVVLADALEDAGCAEQQILRHLRSRVACGKCYRDVTALVGTHPPRYGGCARCGAFETIPFPHVRGCWAIDLILSKE